MKAAGVGHAARAERSRYLERFQRVCEGYGPWDVSSDQITGFLRSTSSRDVRKRAINAINGFYSWAEQQGRVRHNPAADIASE
jgi:site-specific recombinase XerD